MASRILGLDLGAYSVKVVVASPGFRGAQVVEAIERIVPDGDEPDLVRSARVAGEILAGYLGDDQSVYAALAGDRVFLHVLEFEFKTLRRSELTSVVGAELEGVLPIDLEDMVYAFEQIPRVAEHATSAPLDTTNLVGDEDLTAIGSVPVARAVSVRGRVADAAEGMRVLGAATQRSRAEEVLVALRAQGIDPRGLLAVPAPYARLAEKLSSEAGEVVGVLDIGHLRSDFCLATAGNPIFARTMARGGHQLTRALERFWNLDYRRAQEAKHSDGFVASRGMPAPSDSSARINEVLKKELSAFARDVRRTVKSCRAKTGFSVEHIVLLGGGSRLRGMASFLSEQLELRVDLLDSQASERILGAGASEASLDTCALAVGVALDGASSKPSFDLRQGALSYKADSSFLLTKVRSIAAAAVAVMAFGIFSAYTGMSTLRASEKILETRVSLESAAAFGEQLSAADVLDRVGPVARSGRVSPVPAMTAYDMLLAFNAALPPPTKAVLDVGEVDISAGKIVVKASSAPFEKVSALQGIKNLEESLRASECFKDFSSPESQPGKEETRQFTLTIKSKCNRKPKEKDKE